MDFHERLPYDHEEAQQILLEGHQARVWTALPGIVTKYDPVAVTVEVQPAIQGTQRNTDGTETMETMPLLPDVPVCWPRGGAYTLTFPIQPGDECLVVFSSRCIDGWWQSGQVSPQNEPRMHDLSDGFAIIGPFSQATKIASISTTTVQLRSNDGTLYSEVDVPNRKVLLVAGAVLVELNAGTGNITMNATNNIAITAGGTITLNAPTITEN